MITENVSTLKIHKLSKEQYDREVANGRLENNAIYITPDDGAELTVADISDLTATATELNYVDGVTSNIQTQLNNKQAKITGGATTIASSNLTANRALVSNGSGKVAVSAVTSTELGYLDGVTSNVQTQLNGKVPTSRTVNGKALSSNISISASDIGAAPYEVKDGIDFNSMTTSGMYTMCASSTNSPSGHSYHSLIVNHSDTGNYVQQIAIKEGTCEMYIRYLHGSSWSAWKRVAMADEVGGGISSDNPVFTGSISLGRASGTTVGANSVAMGDSVEASGSHSHAEGSETTAQGGDSHAEGCMTICYGENAHAEGQGSIAEGQDSHAEGNYTTASGTASHSEGGSSTASGSYSHAEGYGATASGEYSHSEGCYTSASSSYSHAEGLLTSAFSECSHAEGHNTIALSYQHAQGHYNNHNAAGHGYSSGTDGTAFVIGNGSSTSRSNAFRVGYDGRVYATSSSISTGADYAEYFEWQDLNPDNEDRRGYFATLDGDKIKIAEANDYVLGIVSGQPAIIGNGDEDWRGRYILDEFGAFITEEFEYEEKIPEIVTDEETGKTTVEIKTVTKTGIKYKENPDYDSSLPYVQRADRPEWAAIGMMGVLSVRDDGTCQVNGYCKVAEGGIATASESGYRVIKRINNHIVQVVFK